MLKLPAKHSQWLHICQNVIIFFTDQEMNRYTGYLFCWGQTVHGITMHKYIASYISTSYIDVGTFKTGALLATEIIVRAVCLCMDINQNLIGTYI